MDKELGLWENTAKNTGKPHAEKTQRAQPVKLT